MINKILLYYLLIFILNSYGFGQTIQFYQTGEEFNGPFPSWKNVKTDFGAKGDGVTNDAPAINAALLAMRRTQTNTYNVLYFPSGTYLIDTTLYNPNRISGEDYSGMAVIGEDPSTTIVKWGGTAAGTMFDLNGWYCRVSRLTFDGLNIASRGMFHDGGFGTGCEFSDIIFQNFNGAQGGGVGLDFSAATNGQAENAIIRCRFLDCKYGIISCNWNSLDQWVWYCYFKNCTYAIDLCIGYFQIYNNVFVNSQVYDIGGGNTYQSAVVNNISFNSPCFFQKGPGYLRGNKIYSDIDSFHTVGAQMFDNIFRIGNTQYPIQQITGLNIVGAQNLMVGNTYSNAHRHYPFSWPVQPQKQNFDHAIAASYLVGHPIEKAIDNDSTTWFTCGQSQPAAGIRWNTLPQSPRVVVKYSIQEGGHPGDTSSDPKSWLFRASNDWGLTWTVLDSQVNQIFKWRQKKIFALQNNMPYTLYEVHILTNRANITPGGGGWYSMGELEFIDESNKDITSDTTGLLTGCDETWGNYYPISNVILDTASITVPSIVSLPDFPLNMHRMIFEVQQGTGNDANAIQQKIDSAAMFPLGSKPIVHIPKGNYNVNTSLVVPALKDMQLVGDGSGSGSISTISWSRGNKGPLLKCLGPSRVTLKDLNLNISYHENTGIEGIRIEDADQIGGRIYCNQFTAGSADAAHSCDVGIFADGIENSDVTIICTSYGNASNGCVKAKGGRVLSSGGNTNGQISCLSGASGGCQNLFSVSDGGRIDAEGMWYEGYNAVNTSGLINLNNTSGNLSIACMQWYLNNASAPIINADNFSGNLTILNSYLDQIPRTEIKITGNGSNANIFTAYTDIAATDTIGITTDSIWEDATNPDANASMLGCMAGTGSHYSFLKNVTNKVYNVIPDSTFVLKAIAQLRAVCTEPPMDMVPGVTDVKIFRVASHVREGNIASHFVSSDATVSTENTGHQSEIKVFPNPTISSITVESTSDNPLQKLILYSTDGRVCKLINIQASKFNLDLKDLSAGIYFLHCTGNNLNKFVKLLKY